MPKTDTLKVGVVGLGEVAQILHLPTLKKRIEHFEVVAVCDASKNTSESVARQWGIAHVFQDYGKMLEQADIAAVLVTTPNAFHAGYVIEALEAGKHVMVEKPHAVTEEEGTRIKEAEAKSGKIVQVGFMRNYSPAIEAAKGQLKKLGPARFVRIHDVIGSNRAIVDQIAPVVRGDDYSKAQIIAHKSLDEDQLGAVVGVDPSGETTLAYNVLIGLGSHDIAALMYLFGPPKRVLHAAKYNKGLMVTASLDYGEFEAQICIGIDNIPRYDTYIEVFGDNDVAKIVYDTPFVVNLKQTLEWTSATGDGRGVSNSTVQQEWSDSFDKEWLAFHASVTTGAPVLNNTSQAGIGMRVCRDIIAAFQA